MDLVQIMAKIQASKMANVKYRCRKFIHMVGNRKIYCGNPLNENKQCPDHGKDIGDYKKKS